MKRRDRMRVPETTMPWPESRRRSARFHTKYLNALVEEQRRKERKGTPDAVGSQIQIAKPGLLSSLLRRRTP